MNGVRFAAKGFELVAGIGIDAMITTVANNVIPETYGLIGKAQKICIKCGSVGLSIIATKALEKTIDEYLDALEEELTNALEQ